MSFLPSVLVATAAVHLSSLPRHSLSSFFHFCLPPGLHHLFSRLNGNQLPNNLGLQDVFTVKNRLILSFLNCTPSSCCPQSATTFMHPVTHHTTHSDFPGSWPQSLLLSAARFAIAVRKEKEHQHTAGPKRDVGCQGLICRTSFQLSHLVRGSCRGLALSTAWITFT